jgi:uncharacterized membrane protein
MMRFVDHQHRGQFLFAARDHVTGQLQQQFALVLARGGQSEIAGDILQELERRQPSVEHVGVLDVIALLQQLQQAAQQQSLAGPHLSG